ncbi:MAG: 3-oxoadipate enol-lactonase [Salaquimonas sp.]|nr:3-oxoadipate enol-lactonase [Salaquimonas sp.]
MQFDRINGLVLHYVHISPPSGAPTIVFSNSLGTDLRIWDEVMVDLAADYGVVLYDKRGHGLSDIGKVPYSMADHVGDLAGLLDHLGVKNAIVCGLSVGGMIAQGLYSERPDLVRALVLCDTAHKIGTQESWNDRIDAVTQRGVASISGAVLERWFVQSFRTDTNPAYAGARNMLVRTPLEGYVGTCMALRDTDYTANAKKIAVPTLCVVGAEDGSTPPAMVRQFANLIPGARYEVVDAAAHLPCIEQPEALAGLIRDFLAGLDG